MKKLFIFILLIIAAFSLTFAQKADMLNPQNYFYAGKLALFSTFATDSGNKDSLTLNVFMKIIQNNLLYIQKDNGDFIAQYNIEFSFADNDGVIRFHKLFTDSIISNKSLTSNYDFHFTNIFRKFTIPNKKYNLTVRATDLTSKQSENIEVSYNNKSDKSEKSFSYLFLSKKNIESNYHTVILNNNLNFSAETVKLLFNIPNSSNYNQIKYKITRQIKSDFEPWSEKIDLNGKLTNLSTSPGFIQIGNDIIYEENQTGANYTTTSSDYSSSLDFYEINFKNNPFVPGNYIIKIYLGSKDSLESKFIVLWDDIPLTLSNMNVAMKVSSIFFTKDEMDKISDGSRTEQFHQLMKAWEPFNPNKNIIYNDALMEYYRRADYSFFNFSTFSEKNGTLTDKAKIYILNGPPDEKKQYFKNGKLYEKWTYTKLIKEYMFESIESGVFKLIQFKE